MGWLSMIFPINKKTSRKKIEKEAERCRMCGVNETNSYTNIY